MSAAAQFGNSNSSPSKRSTSISSGGTCVYAIGAAPSARGAADCGLTAADAGLHRSEGLARRGGKAETEAADGAVLQEEKDGCGRRRGQTQAGGRQDTRFGEGRGIACTISNAYL